MAERLALDLLDQGLVTDRIVLTVGCDRESLSGGKGYGRKVPKHAHGSTNLDRPTSSARLIAGAAMVTEKEKPPVSVRLRGPDDVGGKKIPVYGQFAFFFPSRHGNVY